MNDHEILQELLQAKNRLEQQRKIELIVASALVGVLLIAMILAWIKISATMHEARETFVKVNQVTEEIQGIFDGLKEAGIEDPGQAIKDLYDDTEKIRNLFDELKKSGFDDPAQVLRELREASERLNALYDRLSEMGLQGVGQSIEQGVEQGVEQGLEAFGGAKDWLFSLFG